MVYVLSNSEKNLDMRVNICFIGIFVLLSESIAVSYIKQFINNKSFFSIKNLLKRPVLCLPDVSVTDLLEINPEALAASGIRAVVFDKDNTLTIPFEDNIHPSSLLFLSRCEQVTKSF